MHGVRSPLNLANALTTARILLLPLFITLLVYHRLGTALVVLCLAAVTDAFDGLVARLYDQKTPLGSFLDPLADKLLAMSSFVTLTVAGPIPAWFVIVVISRDVIVSLGSLVFYLHEHRLDILPTWTGKSATLCQFLSIIATLGHMMTGAGEAAWLLLLGLTAGLTVVSGVQYVWRGLGQVGGKSAAGSGS